MMMHTCTFQVEVCKNVEVVMYVCSNAHMVMSVLYIAHDIAFAAQLRIIHICVHVHEQAYAHT